MFLNVTPVQQRYMCVMAYLLQFNGFFLTNIDEHTKAKHYSLSVSAIIYVMSFSFHFYHHVNFQLCDISVCEFP